MMIQAKFAQDHM